jgi:hypothetical protein
VFDFSNILKWSSPQCKGVPNYKPPIDQLAKVNQHPPALDGVTRETLFLGIKHPHLSTYLEHL